MRLRGGRDPLPESWRTIARERLHQWPLLDDDQRDKLGLLASRVLRKRWEASHGFAIDEEMRITVAVNAALLFLGHDDEPFSNVTAVVLHPTTMELRGERPGPFPGTVTNAPVKALGHTSARGPVYIAWDTVAAELASPNSTTNVVLHEFAHKMDALNGVMDGTPVLADAEQLRTWVEVCTAELAALRRGQTGGILRPYAATNPSEFFAVATETFFQQPGALRSIKPALYAVLAGFYRQDPATRAAANQDAAPSAESPWVHATPWPT
jgi:Mlc titration factor MtfA (ptsG expression regulator)